MANTRLQNAWFGQGSVMVEMCSAPNDLFPFESHLIHILSESWVIWCQFEWFDVWWLVKSMRIAHSNRVRIWNWIRRRRWNCTRWRKITKRTKLIRPSSWQFKWKMCHCICFYRPSPWATSSHDAPCLDANNGNVCSALHSFYTNSFSQTTEFRMQMCVWNKCVLPLFPFFAICFSSFLFFEFRNERACTLCTSNFNYTHFEFVPRRVSFTWK